MDSKFIKKKKTKANEKKYPRNQYENSGTN